MISDNTPQEPKLTCLDINCPERIGGRCMAGQEPAAQEERDDDGLLPVEIGEKGGTLICFGSKEALEIHVEAEASRRERAAEERVLDKLDEYRVSDQVPPEAKVYLKLFVLTERRALKDKEGQK